jgi:hypothetical protein
MLAAGPGSKPQRKNSSFVFPLQILRMLWTSTLTANFLQYGFAGDLNLNANSEFCAFYCFDDFIQLEVAIGNDMSENLEKVPSSFCVYRHTKCQSITFSITMMGSHPFH